MKPIKTADDFYRALGELIVTLKDAGHSRLADILDHRLRHVVWTTQSELFEELKNILGRAGEIEDEEIAPGLRDRIGSFLVSIGRVLENGTRL
jgi:hypothetical protein